jgi:hypothetical protein
MGALKEIIAASLQGPLYHIWLELAAKKGDRVFKWQPSAHKYEEQCL